jgi:hypothetical protein
VQTSLLDATEWLTDGTFIHYSGMSIQHGCRNVKGAGGGGASTAAMRSFRPAGDERGHLTRGWRSPILGGADERTFRHHRDSVVLRGFRSQSSLQRKMQPWPTSEGRRCRNESHQQGQEAGRGAQRADC